VKIVEVLQTLPSMGFCVFIVINQFSVAFRRLLAEFDWFWLLLSMLYHTSWCLWTEGELLSTDVKGRSGIAWSLSTIVMFNSWMCMRS
jgi:hypothetical protein